MIYLTIPDMACSACSDTITQVISTLDERVTVETNLTTKKVTVDTSCSETEIKDAIASAGYTPT